MAKAQVNGVSLFYELTGRTGPPLALVHGSWGDHHSWDTSVPLLAKSFRVLTYDRRGHSQSEGASGQGSIHQDAADLEALLQHLGIAPACIAGNSFGASITLILAIRRPDLFSTLVIHEPPLLGLLSADPELQPVLRGVRQRLDAVVQFLSSGDISGGAKQFVETVAFGPGAWDKLPADRQGTFIQNAPTFLDELHEPDAFTVEPAALSAFPHRALLTYGDKSPPFYLPILRMIG